MRFGHSVTSCRKESDACCGVARLVFQTRKHCKADKHTTLSLYGNNWLGVGSVVK